MQQLRNLVAVATAALAVGGLASVAHAGGYVSLGIGADAQLSGDMAQHFSTQTDDSGSARIALGQRLGRFAIEVSLSGTDVESRTARANFERYSATTAGVTGKYYIPLSGRLEGFGKLGLDKTWLVGEADDPATSYSGRGYSLGGGLQYTIESILLGSASIWVDYTHQSYELRDVERPDIGGGAQLVTVGVSLGF
jgi:hypothetical protein